MCKHNFIKSPEMWICRQSTTRLSPSLIAFSTVALWDRYVLTNKKTHVNKVEFISINKPIFLNMSTICMREHVYLTILDFTLHPVYYLSFQSFFSPFINDTRNIQYLDKTEFCLHTQSEFTQTTRPHSSTNYFLENATYTVLTTC